MPAMMLQMYAHAEFIGSAHVLSGGAQCSGRFICIEFDFKLRLLRVLLCVGEGKDCRWMLGCSLIVALRAVVY